MTAIVTVSWLDISARLEVLENGVAFLGPLTYKGAIVRAEGRWCYGVQVADTALLGKALEDCFAHAARDADQTAESLYNGADA